MAFLVPQRNKTTNSNFIVPERGVVTPIKKVEEPKVVIPEK